MAEDECRPGVVEDRISGLPDELLHCILVDLGSVRAAARTSVLSSRWRRVWTQIPELVLFNGDDQQPPDSFLTSVDAALAAHSAPVVKHFHVKLPTGGPAVPAGRVAQWLRGASPRVVGILAVYVPRPTGMSLLARFLSPVVEEEELEIPACGGAAMILLTLDERWRLRLPAAGLFASLTLLAINFARVEGSELTALVSTQCPRLRELYLSSVTLCTVSDLSMRTDSLEELSFTVDNTRCLDVVAPRLERLTVCRDLIEANISAPKLAKLVWLGRSVSDPRCHKFADVGRCLRLLDVNQTRTGASLLRRFDTVDELKLNIAVEQEILGYQTFLNETKKLPKSDILSVTVLLNHHGLVPVMVHLLRSCSTTRKLSVALFNSHCDDRMQPCQSSCQCRLATNCKIDDITLGSLEEVEISYFTGYQEELEFVEQLSRCNAAVLKKIVICYTRQPRTPLTKEVCDKVRSKCRSNLKVEFYTTSDMLGRVPFE